MKKQAFRKAELLPELFPTFARALAAVLAARNAARAVRSLERSGFPGAAAMARKHLETCRRDYQNARAALAEQAQSVAAEQAEGYSIHAKEPDGWLKAWEVRKDGVPVAHFRYRDCAESYIADRTPALVR